MQFGRVRGSVVATVKADGLEGVRLLLVEPLDDDLTPTARQWSPPTPSTPRARATSCR